MWEYVWFSSSSFFSLSLSLFFFFFFFFGGGGGGVTQNYYLHGQIMCPNTVVSFYPLEPTKQGQSPFLLMFSTLSTTSLLAGVFYNCSTTVPDCPSGIQAFPRESVAKCDIQSKCVSVDFRRINKIFKHHHYVHVCLQRAYSLYKEHKDTPISIKRQ